MTCADCRRVFSHAFSDKSLRDQEPIIASYINKMSDQLHEICDKPVNMSAWFNYVLFDMSGDLVLRDSFKCLENGALHVSFQCFLVCAAANQILAVDQQPLFRHQRHHPHGHDAAFLASNTDLNVLRTEESAEHGE